MASALVLEINGQRFTNPEEAPFPGVALSMNCLFFSEADPEVRDNCGIDVRFAPDATAAQIENAIEDAILECKNQFWPTMDLQRGDMIMFDIKRGSGIL